MGLPITLYQEDLNGLQQPEKSSLDRFIRERFPSVVYPGHDLRSIRGTVQPLSPTVRQELYSCFVNGNNRSNADVTNNDMYDFEWDLGMNSWNLEQTRSVDDVELSSYKADKNYNNTLWLYFTESNSFTEFYLYDTVNSSYVKAHLDQGLTRGLDELTTIDAAQINERSYMTLMGFKSGKVVLVTTKIDARARSSSTSEVIYEGRASTHPIRSNSRYSGILEVSASLLPDYALSFNIKEGLILNKLRDGTLYNIPLPYSGTDFADLDASHFIAELNFPQFVLSNGVQVWNFGNILQLATEGSPADHEIRFWLKPDEKIRAIKPLPYLDQLFMATSERGLSVPLNPDAHLRRGNSVRQTTGPSYTEVTNVLPVFSLADHNDNQYQVESFKKDKYLLVTQQHLYSTALTIYQNSTRSHEWYTLGFIDIRTRFNISKAKKMSVLESQNGPPQLAIHCDDGSIKYFNITI